MSICDSIRQHLLAVKESSLTLSFVDAEGLIGQAFPNSVHEYDAWRSNEDTEKTTIPRAGLGRLPTLMRR
jgi:hypothetical protein